MSLLPYLLDEPACSYYFRPSRILDQQFGLGLNANDLLQPWNFNHRLLARTPAGYIRNWRSNSSQDSGSTVSIEQDKFEANLDVQQFTPEEITVKVTGDNILTIEGKHEEQQDEHGYISRHFVRRYVLPKNYDIGQVESKLSSDGVLKIIAPRVGGKGVEHKTISITQTGEPAKQQPLEQKK